MEEYQKMLADRLLSEERPITYRLLSRALDVHVNTAKSMLYEFHKYQNSQRADSIRATYLLYGTKYDTTQLENTEMNSSFSETEPESFSEPVTSKIMTLVSEERLEDALQEYQDVSAIHVYSLAPAQQKDQATLIDVAQSISEYAKQADPTTSSTKYGAIRNVHVRRRERSNRPIVQTSVASKPLQRKESSVEKPVAHTIDTNKTGSAKRAENAQTKEEILKSHAKVAAPSSASAGRKTAPSTNRSNSGGIMQSFAKATSKSASKVAKSVKKEDDSTMALSDDGEADDSDFVSSKPPSTQRDALYMKRKEREENLRRMMEEDMEDEESKVGMGEDNDEDSSWSGEEEDEEEEEPDLEMPAELETDAKAEEEEAPMEQASTSGNGRRRVRRCVMKKKRFLDEKGYMVTTQEPVWESFSEDEPAPKKAVKKPSPSSTPTATTKKGKTEQGNIRSFFSKK